MPGLALRGLFGSYDTFTNLAEQKSFSFILRSSPRAGSRYSAKRLKRCYLETSCRAAATSLFDILSVLSAVQSRFMHHVQFAALGVDGEGVFLLKDTSAGLPLVCNNGFFTRQFYCVVCMRRGSSARLPSNVRLASLLSANFKYGNLTSDIERKKKS